MTRFLLVLLLAASFFSYSQPGKLGNATIIGANTIVNKYSTVVSNASAGSSTITVNDITADLGGLAMGDLIMIYQVQGASIQTTDDNNYGAILNYNNSGNYEYAYVLSTSGNSIAIACKLKNSYSVAGRCQVVKIPLYNNLTINSGASLTAAKWNGTTGGILAVHVSGTLTNNGTISAAYVGFRGGRRDNLAGTAGATMVTLYRSPMAVNGGEKGESIAGGQSDYDAAGMGGRYGRGAPANGGGGGNSHNAAGGGGANGNNGLPWTGAGVMDPNPAYIAAWQFDPDFVANGNALTNSSGGGRGGYTYGANDQNAFLIPLSDTRWGGDNRNPVGGRGGRPLNAEVEKRIFFGGGGGAGDGNNNASNDGGDGGGIVYIIANTINGTGVITAQGQNGFNTLAGHNDAPGGGGGGGSIVVKAINFTGQTLNANGGSGGNQLITGNESEGCGGGGGGGFIAVPTSVAGVCGITNAYTYIYGTNGVSSSSSITEFPPNGGTWGAVGQNDVPVSPYFMAYTLTCLIDDDVDAIDDPSIDIDDDNDGIVDRLESFNNIDPSADHDNDLAPNYADPSFAPYRDINCDGINDYFDFDLDGIPDFIDLDSDNDGITDCIEAGGTDADRDGIIDGFVDANADGLSDQIGAGLVPSDMDGDGRYSFRDQDSDGDGITDCVEAGGTDANNDGVIDGFTDTDRDGLANSVDPTTNRLALTASNSSGSTPLSIPDTDGDSKKNYLDIDSDNDGVSDNVEGQTTAAYAAPLNIDSDGDGIANSYDGNNGGTPISPVNTDGTDQPDYLDIDSDNDNVADAIEANDHDSDGNPSPVLPVSGDADGDGLLDGYDLVNGPDCMATGMNGTGSSSILQNTDGDAQRDWRDADDDGDCMLTGSTGVSGENTNSNSSWADDFGQGGAPKPNYLYANNSIRVTNEDRCGSGSVTLNASAANPGTFRWYTALTGGTLVQTNTSTTSGSYTSPTLTTSTTYYVEFDNGVCVTSRKPVIASIVDGLNPPSTVSASRCNFGTVTLSASYGTLGTFTWYDAVSGGNLLQTTTASLTSNFTTPSVSSTTTYYVQFDNGSCATQRVAATATIQNPPVITVTDGYTCGNTSATLAASSSVTGTFNWYSTSSGGSILFTESEVLTSNYITPYLSSNTTYYVEFISASCNSVRTPVTAHVSSSVTAPAVTNNTICSTGSTTLSATSGTSGTFRWYTVSLGGTPVKTESGTSSTYLTQVISSDTRYYVEFNNGTCTSIRVPVSAYVVANSVSATGASRCGTGSVTLAANSSVSGTFNWYSAALGGVPLFTSASGVKASNYVTPNLSSTTTYYVDFTSSSPACATTSPRVAVTATIGASVTLSVTNATSCTPGTVTLNASTGGSGTFRWYSASNGGTLLQTTSSATSSNYTTPYITNTTDYYVEFDNGVCTVSPRRLVRASIISTTELIGTDDTRCGNGSVSLLVLSATSGTFNWYTASSGGSPVSTSSSNQTSHTFSTPSLSTTTTYYVELTSGSCVSSRIPVVANILPAVTAPTAINGSKCGTGSVTLAASSSVTGIIRWYSAASGGTLLQTDDNTNLSTFVTPSISATTNYYAEFSNGGYCTSARTLVKATVNTGTAPAPPTASDMSRCGNGTVVLTATSSGSGIFRWYSAASGGTLLQTTLNATTSNFTTPVISATTGYYVEFDNGTCVSSSRRLVKAIVNALPNAPTANDAMRCDNGTVDLSASSSTVGTFRWYGQAAGGIVLFTASGVLSSTYTTPVLGTSKLYYVEFDNGTCTSARTSVMATVNSTPASPSVTNGSRCGTGTLVLSATSSSNGTFRWYNAPTNGTLLATNISTASSSFTTPSISSTTTYYVEFDNGTCTSTRSSVTASIMASPVAPTGENGFRCNPGTIVLSASSASTGTFRWYTSATGGALLETDAATSTSSFTTPTLNNTVTYYVEFDNGVCASVRTPVYASVPAPDITLISSTSSGSSGIITISASVSPGTLEYSLNGTTYQSSNVFSGLANGTYTVYVREASSLCTATHANVIVKSNVPPTVLNKTTTVNEDVVLTGDLTDSGDSDPDGTSLVVNTVPIVSPAHGFITIYPDGTYTYTPVANYFGSDAVIFEVCDSGTPLPVQCVTRTLTITVNAVNDPAVAVNDDNTSLEDVPVTFNITDNDTDVEGTVDASTVDLNSTLTGIQNTFTDAQGIWSVTSTGTLTYSPTANFNGVALITYTVRDNSGATSSPGNITVIVTPVNDEPSFVKGANQTVNEDAGSRTVTGWASSINKGTTNESTQTLIFTVTNDNTAIFSVQPSIYAPTGTLTYTLAANAFGMATVTVVLKDDGGTANGGDDTFTTQTFTISVNPVNDEPSFTKGSDQTVNEDAGAQTVSSWATSLSKGPANESTQMLTFTLINNNNALFSVQPAISSSGVLTYTPATNASGVATVSVVLKDDGGTANGGDDTYATQTFTITVTPVNDAPVAVNDSKTTNEDVATTLNVTTNDTDVDGT
ncbi:tandem-95 repeat protein, partial [Chryseosolibacter indicus]